MLYSKGHIKSHSRLEDLELWSSRVGTCRNRYRFESFEIHREVLGSPLKGIWSYDLGLEC